MVDPYRSESAKSADLYIQPRPATDPMLAMALMRILIERGWADLDFLAAHTTGFDAVRARIMQTSLTEASSICDVPRARMEEFAELYACNTPSLIHIGVGLQRNSNGGEIVAAGILMHGKTSLVEHDGATVYRALPNPLEVGRYHSLAAHRDRVPDVLNITATTAEGEVMGVRHETLSVEGVQFHPESVLTPEGPKLLENFLYPTRTTTSAQGGSK